MKTHRRLFATLALLAFTAFTVACIDEKETLTVYPDGSGTIHLHTTFSKELSDMLLSMSKTPNDTALDSLYGDLAKWEGVAAWSPVKGSVENGLITTDAVGYFEDISRLKKTDQKSPETYVFTHLPPGGFRLVRTGGGTDDSTLPGNDSSSPEGAAQFLAMLKGLRLQTDLVLPGNVQTCAGCSAHDARTGSFILTVDDLQNVFAKSDAYRKRIASKELTPEQANEQFKKEVAPLSGNLDVTCAPGQVGDEFAQFKKDFAKAKADYDASGMADKIRAKAGPGAGKN